MSKCYAEQFSFPRPRPGAPPSLADRTKLQRLLLAISAALAMFMGLNVPRLFAEPHAAR